MKLGNIFTRIWALFRGKPAKPAATAVKRPANGKKPETKRADVKRARQAARANRKRG